MWQALLIGALAIIMALSAAEMGAQKEKAKWCKMIRAEIQRVVDNPGQTFEMSPDMVRLYNTCTEEDFNSPDEDPLPLMQ